MAEITSVSFAIGPNFHLAEHDCSTQALNVVEQISTRPLQLHILI